MKTIVLISALILGTALINAQSRAVVKPNNLPKPITENLTTKHAGWTIAKAYKVSTNGIMSYEVDIVNGDDKMKLFYDNGANYVREENMKSGAKKGTHNSSSQRNHSDKN